LSQRFANPLILALLLASALSTATGDVASFIIVAAIVLLSVLLDFVQESRAQNAVDALREQIALRADVRRDGVEPACRWLNWYPATSCGSRRGIWCPRTACCWPAAISSSTRRF
jgi:magnesium-transporting ATPase (P-type)